MSWKFYWRQHNESLSMSLSIIYVVSQKLIYGTTQTELLSDSSKGNKIMFVSYTV